MLLCANHQHLGIECREQVSCRSWCWFDGTKIISLAGHGPNNEHTAQTKIQLTIYLGIGELSASWLQWQHHESMRCKSAFELLIGGANYKKRVHTGIVCSTGAESRFFFFANEQRKLGFQYRSQHKLMLNKRTERVQHTPFASNINRKNVLSVFAASSFIGVSFVILCRVDVLWRWFIVRTSNKICVCGRKTLAFMNARRTSSAYRV